VSAFDNQALEAAIKRYVRACGGDPDGASLDAVAAEREIEAALEEHAIGGSVVCHECGEELDDD
jgi:hypothetical protein